MKYWFLHHLHETEFWASVLIFFSVKVTCLVTTLLRAVKCSIIRRIVCSISSNSSTSPWTLSRSAASSPRQQVGELPAALPRSPRTTCDRPPWRTIRVTNPSPLVPLCSRRRIYNSREVDWVAVWAVVATPY